MRISVVEDIPLHIYFADTAVGVAACKGAVIAAVTVRDNLACRVDDYPAPFPRPGRAVAVAVGKLAVIFAGWLAFKTVAAVDEDVFIADFSDTGSLKEPPFFGIFILINVKFFGIIVLRHHLVVTRNVVLSVCAIEQS